MSAEGMCWDLSRDLAKEIDTVTPGKSQGVLLRLCALQICFGLRYELECWLNRDLGVLCPVPSHVLVPFDIGCTCSLLKFSSLAHRILLPGDTLPASSFPSQIPLLHLPLRVSVLGSQPWLCLSRCPMCAATSSPGLLSSLSLAG